MVELVDTRDLKSLASDSVRVRFPLAAPRKSPVFALNTGLFVTFLPFIFLCILSYWRFAVYLAFILNLSAIHC